MRKLVTKIYNQPTNMSSDCCQCEMKSKANIGKGGRLINLRGARRLAEAVSVWVAVANLEPYYDILKGQEKVMYVILFLELVD